MSSSSPPTSHTPLLPSHHLLPPPTSSSTSLLPREYRKGNWTLHETLVLITAKRLDDERRALSPKPNLTNNPSSSGNTASPPPQCGGGRSAELRWKWVENYCWRNGCLRSQNQCNDKWDNLLRDYKKVRHYEMKLITLLPKDCKNEGAGVSGGSDLPPNNNNDGSYWKMEKHERKERNLPANLVAEVFHALTDVLNRRNSCKGGQHHNAIGGSNSNINPLQLTISPRRPSLSIMPVVAAASMAFTPAVPPSQSTSTLAAVGHPPLSTIRAPTPVPPMKTHPPEPSVLGIRMILSRSLAACLKSQCLCVRFQFIFMHVETIFMIIMILDHQ